MERGSNKHGPRLDDEMARELQGTMKAERTTRVEEWRDLEPSGEDQPDVDRDPAGTLQGGLPEGMTPRDIEMRSMLAQAVGKEVYPATREMLLEQARENSAPGEVVETLQELPEGMRMYQNIQEVWTALGGGSESQRF